MALPENPSKADYIKHEMGKLFEVDEDDNWLERGAKGVGDLFGKSVGNTGANIGGLIEDSGLGNYIPGWDGGGIDTNFSEEDFYDAIYSVPALKGLKLAPSAMKALYKTAKKGGIQKGLSAAMKQFGPGSKAAQRTSGSQLASLSGLGSKAAGKTRLGGALKRGAGLAGTAMVGNEIVNHAAGTPNSLQDKLAAAAEKPDLTLDQPANAEDAGAEAQDQAPAQDSVDMMQNQMGHAGMTVDNINARNNMAASMPDQINRLGGSGSKMPNMTKARIQADANRMMQDDMKRQKKADDRNSFLRDRYDATGGRSVGAWDSLSPAQQAAESKNYSENSYYDSNPNATGGTAVSDIARAELGMPSMEEQRLADLDAAVEKQQRSQMGYGVAADPENYQGDLASTTKEEFSDKTGMYTPGTGITRNADGGFNTLEFGDTFDQSGGMDTAEDYLMGREQQGPIQPNQNAPRDQQGPILGDQNTARPIGGGVAGGADILDNLNKFGPGSGQAPVETAPGQFTPESTETQMTDSGTNPFDRQNIDEPWRNRSPQYETNTTPASYQAPEYQGNGRGAYTNQFGQQSPLSKGTVRVSANEQDYGGTGFANAEDALGYINRGGPRPEPVAEEAPEAPAPEAPEAPEAPAPNSEQAPDQDTWRMNNPYAWAAGAGLGAAALFGGSKLAKPLMKAFSKKPQVVKGGKTLSSPVKPMQGPMPQKPMQGPMPMRPTQGPPAPPRPMQGPMPMRPTQGPPMPKTGNFWDQLHSPKANWQGPRPQNWFDIKY